MEEIFEKMPVITSDEIPASDNLVQKTCMRQQDRTTRDLQKPVLDTLALDDGSVTTLTALEQNYKS